MGDWFMLQTVTNYDLLDGRMAELPTVHDPRGYPPKVVGKRLAERPETLDGKLVYLVDCLFDNSASPRSARSSSTSR